MFSKYDHISDERTFKIQIFTSSNIKPKRSSDVENEEPFDTSHTFDNGGGEWLEKRDHKAMAPSEKLHNSMLAKQERSRKSSSSHNTNKITKHTINSELKRSVNHHGSLEFDLNDTESEDEVDEANRKRRIGLLQKKSLEKSSARSKRALNRSRNMRRSDDNDLEVASDSEHFINSEDETTSSSEAASADDEEDEGDEIDADFADNEDMDKKELQDMATRILNKCDTTITNLRASLRAWAGKTNGHSATSIGEDEEEKEKENEIEDCVGLLEIQTNVSSSSAGCEVLNEDDIRLACPNVTLKSYQLVGVNWLKLLHQNKVNGVLADDMGLGKTVQTIAFLGWLKMTTKPKRPHLIVVPASTLANWCNEIDKFCPTLSYIEFHGTQKERDFIKHDLSRNIQNNSIDIVLSTYTIFERESCKEDQNFLRRQRFEYVILDEAHCIKNPASSRFQKLNALTSVNRLLLSGTPVQNDIKELLALLSFLMPKIFSRSDCEILLEAFGLEQNVKDKYASLLSNAPSTGKGTMTIAHLRSMFAPFVLRRLKRQVLDQLPAKTTLVQKVTMTEFQQKIYDNIIRAHATRKSLIKNSDENYENLEGLFKKKIINSSTVIGNNVDVVQDLNANEVRNIFTSLRKGANHPLLLRVRYVDDEILNLIANTALSMGYYGKHCDDLKRIREEIESSSDFDIHRLCLQYPKYLGHLALGEYTLFDSPKMSFLQTLLPQLRSEGRRVLIFSQWNMILDIMEAFLESIDYKYLRLDGSTPIKERQAMIDEFSTPAPEGELHPIPVFLLSTKAGGLGINLTAADTVIMHDLDFNPENDRQAEDRSHRIGQTKEVRVYKLVTLDSVDEDIFDMGERKSRLTEAVLNDNVPAPTEEDEEEETKVELTKRRTQHGDEGVGDIGAIGRILQKALQRLLKK